MKRKLAVLFSVAVVCGALLFHGMKSGSGDNAAGNEDETLAETGTVEEQEETAAAEEEPEIPQYEYTFRELPRPNYLEPAEEFAGGTGTPEDPYQIADAAQLQLFANRINDRESNKKYGSASYILTADIVLNDTSDFDNWSKKGPEYSWKTAGNGTALFSFSGDFDGNDHTISGLYINENHWEEGKTGISYGLFGRVSGIVHDLTIDQSYVAVSGYPSDVGAVTGSLAPEGVIDNCVSNAVMECYDSNCGGIAGSISGGYVSGAVYKEEELPAYSVIRNCKFTGTIEQKKDDSLSLIGGIAGAGKGHIVSCSNKGAISFGSADADSVGGMIGMLNDGMIAGCEHAGVLECQTESAEDSADVGGIAGKLYLSGEESETYMSHGIVVRNCKNTGVVSGEGYAGGIAGNAANDRNEWCLTVEACENLGVISEAEYAGGILGRMVCDVRSGHGSNLVLKDCTNSADMTAENVGGMVGQFDSMAGAAVLRNCNNTGNLTAEAVSGAGVIAYWMMDSDPDIRVLVEECGNSGTVEAQVYTGGVCGLADQPGGLEETEQTAVVIQKCRNKGALITRDEGGASGNIIGSLAFKHILVVISACTNSRDSLAMVGRVCEEEKNAVYIKD